MQEAISGSVLDDGPVPRGDGPAGNHVGVNAEQRFDPLCQIHEPQTDRRVDLDQNINVAGLGLMPVQSIAGRASVLNPQRGECRKAGLCVSNMSSRRKSMMGGSGGL
jgi:hypothetical protein